MYLFYINYILCITIISNTYFFLFTRCKITDFFIEFLPNNYFFDSRIVFFIFNNYVIMSLQNLFLRHNGL